MKIIREILLILFVMNFVAILIASVMWKKDGIKYTEFFMNGSWKYRDLSKYIRPNRIKAFLALGYSTSISFLLFVFSTLLFQAFR